MNETFKSQSDKSIFVDKDHTTIKTSSSSSKKSQKDSNQEINFKKRTKKKKHMFAIAKWLKGNRQNSQTLLNSSFLSKNKKTVAFNEENYTISESSITTSSSSTQEPEALDGGYGWVIVFSSFLIHFICDGISFSFGVMFPELQTHFHASKFLASIPGSVFLSIPLLGGPIAAVVTDVYDCRNVTIAGGLIASIGVFLSYFCNDIATFTITYGIIGGSGLCLCFNTAIVIVTYYFEKRRALATAIACCGTGAGTIINPPVMEYLLSTFGWSKFLLFQGVWLLGLVFCGLIMRDVSWPQDTQEYKEKKFFKRMEKNRLRMEKKNKLNQGLYSNHIAKSPFNNYTYLNCRLAQSLPEIPTHIQMRLKKMEYSLSNQHLKNIDDKNPSVCKDLPPIRSKSYGYFTSKKKFMTDSERETDVIKRIESTFIEIENNHNLNHLSLECGSLYNGKHHPKQVTPLTHSLNALDLYSYDSDEDFGLTLDGSSSLSTTESSENCSNVSLDGESSKGKSLFESESSPVLKKAKNNDFKERMSLLPPDDTNDIMSPRDAFLMAHSNQKLEKTRLTSLISATLTSTHGRVPATNAMIACGHRFNRLSYQDAFRIDRVPSAPNIYFRRRRKYQKGVLKIKRIYEFFKDTAIENWELLQITQFRIFLLSVFILYMFFDIPYVNLPEYAVDTLGVTENQSSFLISSIGFFNMVFMLLLGMISDWKYTRNKVLQIYGLFVVAAGVAVLFAPSSPNYICLLIYGSLFGGFISANYVLASVLTVDLLSFHCFQSGYGLLNLAQGFGNFIGPSFVGLMYDQTGSYQIIFYIGSCGIILSGLIVLSLYYIKRKNARNSKKTHFADPLIVE
ncbi:Major facilitator superfamily and Major facilitator superfamily domain, general substrate transporter and Major facilitator superfamily domain-containing protein [Strongyloides ratti]|uniref:Major facilitator superfamily and Major facilitator superfamily domain, general substrate transporter and Major facilitator superfamily domain-containing protein n=1 Tax=Strongyloides ratti TaxID=34506 RepID=A0A090KVG1_STRRB|nr:Major facilitator superfamily and Major facilitator superfamily domain, general substrate transporter and Major facilitator superfamily domain-containing protein [Strongyloides ratti]CEF59855.1 Major facilitator superfamily and Major facilitator superfamily domain, general substrate transporter and Major facilitator superfamily domain-containing protein [Strongyloides ratti]